jgi:hypothetical protein
MNHLVPHLLSAVGGVLGRSHGGDAGTTARPTGYEHPNACGFRAPVAIFATASTLDSCRNYHALGVAPRVKCCKIFVSPG